MTRKRPDLFVLGAVFAHILIAASLRTTAWPEVTTPAYLVSRGLVLYRDIKFVHTPALMECLGLWFALFGISAWVIRAFALMGSLIAHMLILRETLSDSFPVRFWTSAFFLSLFYSWHGNAVWPSVLIAALSLPMASALGKSRMRMAGLWIGLAITIKQTMGLLLALVVVHLVWKRRYREALTLTLYASLPYAAAALAFTLAGAGREFLTWTLVAPFRIYGDIQLVPTPLSLLTLVAAFLPITIQAILERPGAYEVSTRWYLVVAVGLALLAFPRFGLMEAIACVPCLALGAARMMRRPEPYRRRLALAFVSVVATSTAAFVLAGDALDGRVIYWNERPQINALVERLRRFPPDTPLYAEIWENILPQTGMLPPGRLYAHPFLMQFIGSVDSIEQRLHRAAQAPGVLRVRLNTGGGQGEIVSQWYIIERD